MARISGFLRDGKPLVQVALTDFAPPSPGVSPMFEPRPFNIRSFTALLDTGADICCLCDHVVAECRLTRRGTTILTGGGGDQRTTTHVVNLGVWCEQDHDPNGAKTLYQLADPIEAVAIRNNRWFDVIIGTDVLTDHDFHLTKGGRFMLTLG